MGELVEFCLREIWVAKCEGRARQDRRSMKTRGSKWSSAPDSEMTGNAVWATVRVGEVSGEAKGLKEYEDKMK